jgi:hypothetical protein
MALLRKIYIVLFFFIYVHVVDAQELTQTIRGQVIDAESQAPVAFASIAVVTVNPPIGTITDKDGHFRIEKVTVGRHNFQISCIGYETQLISEILVSSGKEIVLTIKIKEQITKLDEISVKAYIKKDQPINSMATVSARTFSIEEASRYAGGFDDPGRLASSFAGVSTENLRDNSIVIRGNSPKGLLWRLEGVEISNPNHFANMETFGGGGISALSALVVGNSDFFTGAFPSEYGNAVSGVFDIKLRSGNDEKHEHALQIGTMGIDISSEGPLNKNTRASYLFNYRYSTMGLVKEIFPPEIKNFIPAYQDLCFKFNMPTKKSGIFSIWGLASDDSQGIKAEQDSSLWEMVDDRKDDDIIQRIGALGFNHRYIFTHKAYINSSLALTGDLLKYNSKILGDNLVRYEYESILNQNHKYTFTSTLNYKYSPKTVFQTGIVIDNIHYNTQIKYAPEIGQELLTVADEKDNSYLLQYFLQTKLNISEQVVVNAGIRSNYFALNKEWIIEPRLGLTYNITGAQSVGIAYGKHSRLEPLTLYFAKVYDNNDNNTNSQPNKDLKLGKSHHFVFAYDLSINTNLRVKIEPYVQYLVDVPVIADSSFSVLNMNADFYFNQKLINTGVGRNYGIDFTLERFLKNGYYYLFTTSLFSSKYKGDDGIERNTRFNSQFVLNMLYGKEWTLGNNKNKILGANARISFYGGKRSTPVNETESAIAQDVVYNYSHSFSEKDPNKFHANATINYRINKQKFSSIWLLQVINLFMTKENYGLFYNYKTNKVERWEFAVIVPSLSYKIEF